MSSDFSIATLEAKHQGQCFQIFCRKLSSTLNIYTCPNETSCVRTKQNHDQTCKFSKPLLPIPPFFQFNTELRSQPKYGKKTKQEADMASRKQGLHPSSKAKTTRGREVGWQDGSCEQPIQVRTEGRAPRRMCIQPSTPPKMSVDRLPNIFICTCCIQEEIDTSGRQLENEWVIIFA